MIQSIPLRALAPAPPDELPRHDFDSLLQARGLALPPLGITTLQVNITKMCNQVCRHCHVDASPKRTEALSGLVREMANRNSPLFDCVTPATVGASNALAVNRDAAAARYPSPSHSAGMGLPCFPSTKAYSACPGSSTTRLASMPY